MSKKFSARRREAFLCAAAETGNQTLAAERAKVSRSWVSMTRAAEPGFDAAVRAAVLAARQRLRELSERPSTALGTSGEFCASSKEAGSPRYYRGHELVVRGSNGRRVQVARARVKQWTPIVEARFLTALASCCNVKAACAAVGMTAASAYNHRRRRPGFDAAWIEAIRIGYEKLEAEALAAACAGLSHAACDPDAPIPPMTGWQAIHLLHMHKHAVRGIGKAPGGPRLVATNAEVLDAVTRRIAQMKREDEAAARQAERRVARRAAWCARPGPQ